MYIVVHENYQLFLSDFNDIWIFVDRLSKKILRYQIWWRSVQREPRCCVWTDGQTDSMTKLIVAFRNFSNAPKKIAVYKLWKFSLFNFRQPLHFFPCRISRYFLRALLIEAQSVFLLDNGLNYRGIVFRYLVEAREFLFCRVSRLALGRPPSHIHSLAG